MDTRLSTWRAGFDSPSEHQVKHSGVVKRHHIWLLTKSYWFDPSLRSQFGVHGTEMSNSHNRISEGEVRRVKTVLVGYSLK